MMIDRRAACPTVTDPVPLDVIRWRRPGHDAWELQPVEGYLREGDGVDMRWRQFLPALAFPPATEAAWATLWREAHRIIPHATVGIGPVLDGCGDLRIQDGADAERLPEAILISLGRRSSVGPLALLWHESVHELWDRLTLAEQAALRRHGAALLADYRDQLPADEAEWTADMRRRWDWLSTPGEPEAWGFQVWCTGEGLDPGLDGYADAGPVWEAINAGTIARTRERRRGL
jgi:hypothetical protein